MNDNLGKMLIKIKNASLVKHEVILVPYTSNDFLILKALQEEGFINSIKIVSKKNSTSKNLEKYIKVNLKYKGSLRKPFITNITRMSKPSLPLYVNSKNIPLILNGLGVIIMSTPKGIMTSKDAYKFGIGGELLFSIW